MTSSETRIHYLKNAMVQDSRTMLSCIQYEVVQGKSFTDAFESFCEILGDDAMKYSDFDYWYYRFKDGKFDLDHDRSTNPPIPGLSDMPMDVVEHILKYLEWSDRCAVRKVSRNFRVLIDNSKQHFDKITLCTYPSNALLVVQERNSDHCYSVQNFENDDGKVVTEINVDLEPIRQKEVTSGSVLDTSANDLCLILKCPRVEIKELELGFNSSSEEDKVEQFIQTRLRLLDHQIHINRLILRTNSQEEVLSILLYLKPDVLEYIDIRCYDHNTRINIDDIVELDQWKQAKIKTFPNISCNRIEKLHNLPGFDVELPSFLSKDFIQFRNTICSSPNFWWGRVRCPKFDTEGIRSYLGMEQDTVEGNIEISFTSDCIYFDRIR